MEPTPFDYQAAPAWCPGCGNFMILIAVKKALTGLGLTPQQVLICSGIGQAAKLPHYMKCNTFNGLHGRSLPAATAAKLVNPELTVIAEGGDGDMYGEGGNHFLHTVRRNVDITVIVHNNQVYGLTKGQASPTSEPGFMTKVQTEGVKASMMDPLTVALSLDASFVSRSFSGDIEHLSWVIQQAIKHRGLSLVDVLMPCVSFNKLNTFQWYKSRVYKLEDEHWNSSDKSAAYEKAKEWGQRIPTGIFYREERPAYDDLISVLKGKPLIDREYNPQQVGRLFDDFI
jgi:2-oxoglutarate ferredoxin oxidoreductase subunit beta